MGSRNELTIRGTAQQITRLPQESERFLSGEWRRHTEAEARAKEMGSRSEGAWAYARSATDRLPAAGLWLRAWGENEIRLSTLTPLGKRELTDDKYNEILDDFAASVLRPANADIGAEIAITPARTRLGVFLSREAIRRLESFSAAANKTALQPADQRRWQEFIVRVHLERAGLEPSWLEQWLAEEGWPEEQRQNLMQEYEAVRSLLSMYEEERRETCLP